MEILKIKPNEGIGQIKLGMEREEVYKVIRNSRDLEATAEWIGDYQYG